MANNLDALPGLDKAAILFQVLGESLSLSMFQGISESDLLRIRVRSKELINVPFEVKQTIVEEFYFKMMTQKYRQVDCSNSDGSIARLWSGDNIWCSITIWDLSYI